MNFTLKPVAAQVHHRHRPVIPSVNYHRPLFTKPFSSISFRTPVNPSSLFLTPNKASSSSPSCSSPSSFSISQNPDVNENPELVNENPKLPPCVERKGPHFSRFLVSFVKTSIIAMAAAAAALFVSRFYFSSHEPAFAATSAATVETSSNDIVSEEEREKSIEEHLLSYPNDVEALKSLMEIRIKSQKTQEAILIVEKLIELQPEEVEWPLMKSHLHAYVGETELAKNGFNGIISKDPLRVEAYHGLVMAASQDDVNVEELNEIKNRIDQAMAISKKENKKSELRDFKLLVAQINVIESKYNDAIKVYQDLVKEEPRDFRPYLCQGIIFTLLRNNSEAEKNFEKYRRLVPKGHPYARYFEDNLIATKVFAQKVEENGKAGSKS